MRNLLAKVIVFAAAFAPLASMPVSAATFQSLMDVDTSISEPARHEALQRGLNLFSNGDNDFLRRHHAPLLELSSALPL
jgi:hypothetical protein